MCPFELPRGNHPTQWLSMAMLTYMVLGYIVGEGGVLENLSGCPFGILVEKKTKNSY